MCTCYPLEYNSNYVWHETAYSNKPEWQYKRGQPCNYPLQSRHKGSLQQLSASQFEQQQQNQQEYLDRVLNFSFPLKNAVTEMEQGEKQIKFSTSSNSTSTNRKKGTKQKRISVTRRYSLDADARGIKSHFLPASLDVLLDLGLNPGKLSSTSDGNSSNEPGGNSSNEPRGNSANQYFTSVYKSDFSCTN